MGWGFRKSIGFGPFRINLSKSGIGASVGVRGARIGINSRGQKYAQVGRGGLYYRTVLNTSERGRTRSVLTISETGSEAYESFVLPLRFSTAVVQEIHDLLKNLSYPKEFTDRGMVVHLDHEFSLTIEVVPIDEASEVRFYVWQHMSDGTVNLLGVAGERRQQAIQCIEPIIEALRKELGGVRLATPLAPKDSPGQASDTLVQRSHKKLAFFVVCGIVICCLQMYWAAQPRSSSPSYPTTSSTPISSTRPLGNGTTRPTRSKGKKAGSKTGSKLVETAVTGVVVGSILKAQATPSPTPWVFTYEYSKAERSSKPGHTSSTSGDVHVRGYYRKDGTYVRPHTRRR